MRITTIGISILCLGCIAPAGSLNPPAGAPVPTMKTLSQVEPRTPIHAASLPLTITSPGSYYLAENIKVTAADNVTTAAIIIESGNVTIELNGFTLAGSTVSDVSGIVASGLLNNITVRNGAVAGWGESGIDLRVRSATVEDVTATGMGMYAIVINNGRVINCEIHNNLSGIHIPTTVSPVPNGSSQISGCRVFSNGETAILARQPVVVTDTIINRNQGNGVSIYGAGSVIKDCVANRNDKAGIYIDNDAPNSTVMDNTCSDNDETGILITARGCRVERNTVANNDIHGLVVRQRSMVFKNTAYDNTDANYDIVSEAIAGPIVTTTTGGTIASDHPWANFSFHTTRIGN